MSDPVADRAAEIVQEVVAREIDRAAAMLAVIQMQYSRALEGEQKAIAALQEVVRLLGAIAESDQTPAIRAVAERCILAIAESRLAE